MMRRGQMQLQHHVIAATAGQVTCGVTTDLHTHMDLSLAMTVAMLAAWAVADL